MFGLQPEREIDVPFAHRHQCWFCGEPGNQPFHFPHQAYLVIDCTHPSLIVPTCTECHSLAKKSQVNTIWHVYSDVKTQLIHKYRKDLAIGLNWTKQELAESEFDGGNFEGFKRSAWFIFEVAKGRVNFASWPLVLDGLKVEKELTKDEFSFDGVLYPSIDEAIAHYGLIFDIPIHFFEQVLAIIGIERFSYAVRYCRLYVGATPQEMRAALQQLD
jgi:hypothetical protein